MIKNDKPTPSKSNIDIKNYALEDVLYIYIIFGMLNLGGVLKQLSGS